MFSFELDLRCIGNCLSNIWPFSWKILSFGTPATGSTTNAFEDNFEDLTFRIKEVVRLNSQILTKHEHDSSCFRLKTPIEPSIEDLDTSIKRIFDRQVEKFDKRGLALVVESGKSQLLAYNEIYFDMLEKSGQSLRSLVRNFENRANPSGELSQTFQDVIQYEDYKKYTLQLTRSKIFDFQGELACVITQIQQLDRVDLFTSAKQFMKSKHVLVVDDTPTLQKLTNRMLKIHTDNLIACTVVDDGSKAVELFESGHRFDCVLMDLEMPMRGTVAAERIRKISGCARIPIIGWTSNTRLSCEDELLEAGMSAYCHKHSDSTESLFILMSRLIQQQEYDEITELP